MARTLHFLGQTIGTGLVKVTTAHSASTPAAVLTGLFQSTARVVSESRNVVYQLRPVIYHAAADEIAFALFGQNVQDMVGMTGPLQIKDGATVKIRWDTCTLLEAPEPQPAAGFGGCFIPEWPLLFIGSSKPEWP